MRESGIGGSIKSTSHKYKDQPVLLNQSSADDFAKEDVYQAMGQPIANR
jgi:hypothetical protein